MLSSRQLNTPTHPTGSASLARKRLLADQSLRRAPTTESPPKSPALVRRPPTHTTETGQPASPREQRLCLHQIADSFPHHFIARLIYLQQQRLSVACLMPRPSADRSATVPYRITIDSSGNVSVSPLAAMVALHPGAPTHTRRRARIVRTAALLITLMIVSFIVFGLV